MYYPNYAPLPCSYYQNVQSEPAAPYVLYNPCMYYPAVTSPAAPVYYSPPAASGSSFEVILNQLLDNIDKTLNDQSSCRMVQKQLEDSNKIAIVNKLFNGMIIKMGEYMSLPFGNYLCQKMFELLSQDQLHRVI